LLFKYSPTLAVMQLLLAL